MMRVIVEECPAIGDDAHCWWRPLDAHQETWIDGSKLCGEEGVHAEDERLEVGAVEFLKQRPDGLQTVMQEHPSRKHVTARPPSYCTFSVDNSC